MARKENKVQTALMMALHSYCETVAGINLRQFPPYANQQGASMQRYCADLVGMLGNSAIILLEVKELDCNRRLLPKFTVSQHAELLRFERMGVPIAYAYNTQPELEYDRSDRLPTWPTLTLEAINRSQPSLLPRERPAVDDHQTMLNWMQDIGAGNSDDNTELFGRITGVIDGPGDLRNGLLALIYGVEQQTLTALSADEFDRVIRVLKKSTLTPTHQNTLQRILGARARVFAPFSANMGNTNNLEADTPEMDGP